MAINVISQPEPFSFSGNQIVFSLQSNDYLSSAGVAFVGKITKDLIWGAGRTFTIQFGDQRVVMTVVEMPDTSGTQIPEDNPMSPQDPAVLATYFDKNYILNKYFNITTVGNDIIFTARDLGTFYNWRPSDNLVIVTNGVDKKEKPGFKFLFEVFLENEAGTAFSNIYSEYLNADIPFTGILNVDIKQVLNAALENDIPNISSPLPANCRKGKRRFFCRYAEVFDGNVMAINESPKYHVAIGGFSYVGFKTKTVVSMLRPDVADSKKDLFLKQGPRLIRTRTNQPEFLYFLNLRTEKQLRCKVTVKFADASADAVQFTDQVTAAQYGKVYFAVGYELLQLTTYNKQVKEYVCHLVDTDGTQVSESVTYRVDYEYREKTRYFTYASSMGAFDTFVAYGKGSEGFDISQENAIKPIKINYNLADGNKTNYDIKLARNFTVNTGVLDKRRYDLLADFYLSTDKYLCRSFKMLPITVTNKKGGENKDQVTRYSQEITYAYNFDDDKYTEGDVEEPGEYVEGFFFGDLIGLPPVQVPGVPVPPHLLAISPQQILNWDSLYQAYLDGLLGGSGGPATWGNIGGLLADQNDLVQALDLKANVLSLGALAWRDSLNFNELNGRPLSLSEFTNDLGNYGNWITLSEGSAAFQPLENQRLGTGNGVTFRGTHSQDYQSIPASPPAVEDRVPGRTYLYASGTGGGGGTPPTYGYLINLLDVDPSTLGNKYVLYYDAPSGMFKFQANNFGSIAWTDVTGRPTALSQFTNDLGNYGNFALANGSNASGMWGINISGSAALFGSYGFDDILASDFSMIMVRKLDNSAWTNISKSQFKSALNYTGNEITTGINDTPRDIGISKMLRWKNYGDGHVIIDASNGTSPTGSSIGNKDSQQPWTETFPTLMGWNGTSTYGVRVDSARNADKWNGLTYSGGLGSISLIMGYDGTTWGNASVSVLKSFLNMPNDGYDYGLQGVTSRGNNTTNSILLQQNAALLFKNNTGDNIMFVGTQHGATGLPSDNGAIWIYGAGNRLNIYTNGTVRGAFHDTGLDVNGSLYSTGKIYGDDYIDVQPNNAFRLYNSTIGFTGGFGSGSWTGTHNSNTAVLFAPSGKQLGFGAEGANVGTWTASSLSINTSFSSSSYIIGHRVIAGTYDSGVAGSVNTTDHFRVGGNGGVYWATHLLGLVANSENPLFYNNNSSIWLRFATAGGNVIGGIYAESGGSLGFLNASGSWTFQVQGNGNAYVYGALTVSSTVVAGGTGGNIAFNTSLTNRAGIFQEATGNNVVYIANWFDSTKGLSINPVTGLVTAPTLSANKVTSVTVEASSALAIPNGPPPVNLRESGKTYLYSA